MKINRKIILAVALSMAPLYATAQDYVGPDAGQSSAAANDENSAPLFDTSEALKATKKIAEKQSRVNELKVDLTIEQIESQIRALQEEKKEKTVQEMVDARINEALDKQRQELEAKHEAEVEALKAQMSGEVSAVESELKKYKTKYNKGSKGLRNSVFVTKVKTGANGKARIFTDGYVTSRTVGEEVTDGVVLDDITIRGVYVKSSQGRVFLPLVTTAQAYAKTFSDESSSRSEPTESEIEGFLRSQMASPTQPTSSMSQ